MPAVGDLHQLLTSHGTVVFLDIESGELRHGQAASSPRNVFFAPREGAGHLVHAPAAGGLRDIRVAPGLAPTPVQLHDTPSDSPQAWSLPPAEEGTVGLLCDGLYLCAEPDGHVTLSRPEVGIWERFSLTEARAFATPRMRQKSAVSEELVHIVTGYPRTPAMEILEANSTKNGCRFVGLPKHGWRTPFTMHSKPTIVQSYLGTGDVDPGDVVLFTDAYDVLLLDHASVILEKFFAMDADIIFGAEAKFWPEKGREAIKAQFDVYDSKWRYLNGGGYIGYAWAVKKLNDYCVSRIDRKDYDPTQISDQLLQQDFFLEHRNSSECVVALDTTPELFCSLIDSERDFAISRERLIGTRSGRVVSVLHANGNKNNMDIIGRYWTIINGVEGDFKRLDLRIATADGQPLAYDMKQKKLTTTDPEKKFPNIFLIRGRRYAVCLNDAYGYLSFPPDGTIESDIQAVNIWEILDVRDVVTTCHGSDLRAYCEIPADSLLRLAPLPLALLLCPGFDVILEGIQQYAGRF